MKEILKKAGKEFVDFFVRFGDAVEKANMARVQHYLHTYRADYLEKQYLDKK